jgi:cell division protein FtsI (penicillin-binding protein 3)
MNGAISKPSSFRRHLVLVVVGSIALTLMWRAFDLQLSDRQFLQEHGDARYLRDVQIEAHRGMITDRNGEPLAISTPVNSVWVNPSVLIGHRDRWPMLAKTLDMSEDHLKTLLVPRRNREFLFLKRQVHPDVADALEQAAIPGVGLVNEFRRYYPGVEIAAHLIGFTDVDDRGQEGIELAFDSTLRGAPGLKRVIKDRLGRVVEQVERLKPVVEGRDIALSVDRRLQYVANRELKKAVELNKALAGLMVVLDVNTGEVLALANQPSFNPNNRGNLKDEYFRNRAVTDLFEPGSTLKPFTVAAGIDSGLYTPETPIDTAPGTFRVGRHVVRDIHNYGALNVSSVIEKSSNVGVTKIALSIEPQQLWRVLDEVGFGHPTQVELPSEPAGRLNDYRGWREIEHATLSFGYGMSVTALQLARAYAVIASGGILRPISIQRQSAPVEGARVLSEPTALAVRDMLERAVKSGTGKAAAVYGYRVGGNRYGS